MGKVTSTVTDVASGAYNKLKGMVMKSEGGEERKEEEIGSFSSYTGPSTYTNNHHYSANPKANNFSYSSSRNLTSTGEIGALSEGSRWVEKKSGQRKKGEIGGAWGEVEANNSKNSSKPKFDYSYNPEEGEGEHQEEERGEEEGYSNREHSQREGEGEASSSKPKKNRKNSQKKQAEEKKIDEAFLFVFIQTLFIFQTLFLYFSKPLSSSLFQTLFLLYISNPLSPLYSSLFF